MKEYADAYSFFVEQKGGFFSIFDKIFIFCFV